MPIQELTASLMAEVMEYARLIKSERGCMIFPFRELIRSCRVRGHLGIYHKKENNWCASGAKQWRVCKALYDNDKMTAKKSVGRFLSPIC